MSFTTDRPFFPYSEPKSGNNENNWGRELCVTLLSDQYMSGALEEGIPWPAKPYFIGSSTPDPAITEEWKSNQWLELAHLKGAMETPKSLMVCYDQSNLRPGTTDLFFNKDPSLTPLRNTVEDYDQPIIYQWSFSDFIGLGVLIAICVTLIYASVRCFQLSASLESVSSLDEMPPRTSLIHCLDQISGLFCLFFGFFFSLGFLMFPIIFFLKVGSTLRYGDYAKRTRKSLFHPLNSISSNQVSAFIVIIFIIVYVFMVIRHISW